MEYVSRIQSTDITTGDGIKELSILTRKAYAEIIKFPFVTCINKEEN